MNKNNFKGEHLNWFELFEADTLKLYILTKLNNRITYALPKKKSTKSVSFDEVKLPHRFLFTSTRKSSVGRPWNLGGVGVEVRDLRRNILRGKGGFRGGSESSRA